MARTIHDQLAKSLLDESLSHFGQVETQAEVQAQVQAVDVMFVPEDAPDRTGASLDDDPYLCLLSRMVDRPALVEPFHNTPSCDEVYGCLSKQYIVRRKRSRAARRKRLADLGTRLWIVSSGRPGTALADLDCALAEGWPSGFYVAPRLLSSHIVVVRELPETPETLILRLLGAGPTFERALSELTAQPKEVWVVRRLLPILVAFIRELDNNRRTSMRDSNYYHQVYQDMRAEDHEAGRKQGLEQGLEQGREEGRQVACEALLGIYRSRFGTVPEALASAVSSERDLRVLQGLLGPFTTLDRDELDTLLLRSDR